MAVLTKEIKTEYSIDVTDIRFYAYDRPPFKASYVKLNDKKQSVMFPM